MTLLMVEQKPRCPAREVALATFEEFKDATLWLISSLYLSDIVELFAFVAAQPKMSPFVVLQLQKTFAFKLAMFTLEHTEF